MNEAWVPRAVCEGCGRPAVVCLCGALARRSTRTRVVMLQHPRESDVPINTARLAELGLAGAERHVGVDFSAQIEALLADRERPPILLYPGPSARDLSSHPPPGPVTLVVLDGTWSQAQKLFKTNPKLAELPCYALTPPAPSRYQIRREPAENYVSTIEAVALALSALEGERFEPELLLAPFHELVAQQLRFASERGASRHQKPRATRTPRPALLLASRARDLVVAYGEANAWPRGTELGDGSEIVHFAALRLATGERFEARLAPRRPLSPSFTHHTGIPAEAVARGESFESFVERWNAFRRPDDLLLGWGLFAAERLRLEGAPLPARFDLRLAARSVLRARPGEVVSCARRLGEEPRSEDAWALGRTGVRLAAAIAVARGLLARVS